MKTTCLYCGRIHRYGEQCPNKPAKSKRDSRANRFRQTRAWRNKAREIKERDQYLCQYCRQVLGLLNTKNLEVHHIESISSNYLKRLDDDNLLTLCRQCHEDAEQQRIEAEALRALVPPGV